MSLPYLRSTVSLIRHTDNYYCLSETNTNHKEALIHHSEDNQHHSEAVCDLRKLLRSGVELLMSNAETVRNADLLLHSTDTPEICKLVYLNQPERFDSGMQ